MREGIKKSVNRVNKILDGIKKSNFLMYVTITQVLQENYVEIFEVLKR